MHTHTVKKTTQGRKRNDIKKIEEKNARKVTFSKRRAGLFKKASELCVLTGAEIAITVHSEGNRVYAFGHPSPDHVMNRYLTSDNLGSKQTTKIVDTKPLNDQYNQHYLKISKEWEEEKRKNNFIVQSKMMDNGMFWWDEPINGFGTEELEEFVKSAEELKKKVVTRIEELRMIRTSTTLLSSKSLLDFDQTSNQVVEFEDFGQNMDYGYSDDVFWT